MPVFISMSLAALIWSFYPLVASIGLEKMGSLEMILIVYFFSGFGAILLGWFYLWKNKLLTKAIKIQYELGFNAYIPILISGVSGILCHAFFIISLTLASKGGVSLLYESWPIIAVVATPMLMKKKWKEVSFKEFLAGIFALGGVAIIILSDNDIASLIKPDIYSDINYNALGGYILAFAGAYMCAVLVVTKGTYSEYFNDLEDNIASSLVSEVFSRSISMCLMCIAFIALQDSLDIPSVDWAATFYVGFVVFVVGGTLYTYALLNTDRPTIHIMYYFVPIFAVIWLWLAGKSEINSGLFIGGAIIVACNIYLFIAGRKAPLEQGL